MSKITEHIKAHKDVYVAVGVTLLVSAGITGLIVRNLRISAAMHMAKEGGGYAYGQISGNVGSSFIGDNNHVSTFIGFGKNMSKIVFCNETGEWFKSQAEAARHFGFSEKNLSRHLNFGEPIPGMALTFTRMGIAA